ncbi:conserved hypothetical protein [Ixodes scapularis]|uniref:PAZ domain-containing protein n=1 Tax=Ixodes scapularis TaxID=6945 RepID=B7PED9_IXOSC|nr:conserved hypothetical protein [Ixodes scapularis]|eukprot:XP_002433561.1 conserved hypothetical protein [Ixodes scapularis]
MSACSEEEFLGCGRGGRGALLLAALQKQTRRPGTGGSGDSSGDATVTSVVAPLPTDGTPVTVQVKFVKVTPPSQCVHLYNVLFKKVMHCLQLTQIGRNYFDHKGKILIPQHKLEVWPGYVQSVGEFEGGLLLNCDASFRVLRTVTARDVLYDVFNAYRQEYKTKALQAIVGNIVLTRYNNKTYRVDDISWDLKPTSTFTYHTGEEIAYMDYYKRIYNIDIQDTEQPLLLHRDKPRRDAPIISG